MNYGIKQNQIDLTSQVLPVSISTDVLSFVLKQPEVADVIHEITDSLPYKLTPQQTLQLYIRLIDEGKIKVGDANTAYDVTVLGDISNKIDKVENSTVTQNVSVNDIDVDKIDIDSVNININQKIDIEKVEEQRLSLLRHKYLQHTCVKTRKLAK